MTCRLCYPQNEGYLPLRPIMRHNLTSGPYPYRETAPLAPQLQRRKISRIALSLVLCTKYYNHRVHGRQPPGMSGVMFQYASYIPKFMNEARKSNGAGETLAKNSLTPLHFLYRNGCAQYLYTISTHRQRGRRRNNRTGPPSDKLT